MKILNIANFDPAGISISLTKAINSYTPHSCRSITLSTVPYGWEQDISLASVAKGFDEVRELVREADVLHFNDTYWEEVPPFGPIRWREHLVGKRVTVYLLGDTFLNNPRRYLRVFRSLGVHPLAATYGIAELAQSTHVLPAVIPIWDPLYMPSDAATEGSTIRVCHSPTDELGKSTRLFTSVVASLQKEYRNVEGVLIRNVPHRRCLEIKRACHIVFDSIYHAGYFGLSGWEGLSMGVPTLAYVSDAELEGFCRMFDCDKLPIVRVDPNSLYDVLVDLIQDGAKRAEIGKQSRHWIEKYRRDDILAMKYVEFYQGLPVMVGPVA